MATELVLQVFRREDALALTVTITGFELDPPVLRRVDQDARIIVELPPQHVGEEVFAVAPDEYHGQRPQAFVTGPTRLCFTAPDDMATLTYDLASLLDLAALTPVVPEAAVGAVETVDHPPRLLRPEPWETAVELPWRLFLAPPAEQTWTHETTPVEHGGRTEIWHTRLGARARTDDGTWRVEEYRAARPGLRAVWSPDLVDPLAAPPRMLPSGHDRQQIVRATSDWDLGPGAGRPYVPRPLAAERLMLSSAGGWLTGDATFDPPVPPLPVSLESWKHRASLGRDSYVRVVKRGYLYPWGHRASLIEVSERRVHDAHGAPVAVLAYQSFVAVRVPVRDYDGHRALSTEFDHGFPLRRIRVTTAVSPPLDAPSLITSVSPTGMVFACTLGLAPYEFSAVVTDLAGRDLTLGLPAVFVESTVAADPGSAARLDTWWNARQQAEDPLTRVRTLGQRVAFAPQRPAEPGATSLETHFLSIGTQKAPAGLPLADYLAADAPPYFPVVRRAFVTLSAAQGVSTAPLGTPEIAYDPAYLTRGFDVPGAGPAQEAQRAAEVFARLVAPRSLTFSGDQSGGLALPSFAIEGLSRSAGPVGDLAGLASGALDPAALFGPLGARLLGAVALSDVIAAEHGADAVQKALQVSRTQLPDAFVTSFAWAPRLQPDPLGVFVPAGGVLALRGQTRVQLADPSRSTYELLGEMGSFAVNFFGSGAGRCVTAHFRRLTFSARSGQRPTLQPDLDHVEFAGPLSFVDAIKDYVSFGGNGPYVEITPTRIVVGVAIVLPSIQVGVFCLENLAIRTQLELSTAGDPARLRFALCSRTQPFLLTVSLFGGGGFFALALSTAGLELVEAALEFGASASVDLGLASGGVSMLAGVYFKLEKKAAGTEVTLAGYFRLHGEMSVIGLISISLDFYLGIEYHSYPDGTYKVSGRASLHVEVKVFLFSTSVEVTCERRFGGTASDPRFVDQVGPADWADYCDAFAPLPA